MEEDQRTLGWYPGNKIVPAGGVLISNITVILFFLEYKIFTNIFFMEYQHFTVFCCNLLKFRQIFIKIQSKNDEIHLKNCKICENVQKIAKKSLAKFCKISEFGAVRRNADLVELEKC